MVQIELVFSRKLQSGKELGVPGGLNVREQGRGKQKTGALVCDGANTLDMVISLCHQNAGIV